MLGHYDYILQSPKGFRVYCDHKNIVTLFHPELESAALSKMAIDKVYRWLYHLGHYRVTHMEHLPGQRNLWADLLSREGNPTYGAKRSREELYLELLRLGELRGMERVGDQYRRHVAFIRNISS